MAESTKRAAGRPPTPEQTEKIKAACATTRMESADAENLLRQIGYEFRTINAAGNKYQTVAQVKSTHRGWRPVTEAWNAITQALRARGVKVSDPVTMFRFETVIERLCFENRVELEDLNAGRYPFYWETDPNELAR